jgi:hypothetical protein
MFLDTPYHPMFNKLFHSAFRILESARAGECGKSGDEFVHALFMYMTEQPFQDKIIEVGRSLFGVGNQVLLSRTVTSNSCARK